MTIPVAGSYEQLVSFIERLEGSPHFVVVDRLQLREGREGRPDELDVGLTAYFRAEGVPGDGD
jgi:hypothetical protein